MPFLQQLISLLTTAQIPALGFNGLDILICVLCLIYAVEGYFVGFIAAIFDLVSFLLSFVLGLTLYSFVAQALINLFGLPQGMGNAAGFFLVAFLSELILNLVFRKVWQITSKKFIFTTTPIWSRINHIAGIIPALLSAAVLLAFLLTLIITLPLSPVLKRLISESVLGSMLVSHTGLADKSINNVFGGAVKDSLNFLTVEPKDTESVNLHFTVKNPQPDQEAEQQMFNLVNQERTSRGIAPLVFDTKLRDVGRAHAKDMFVRGYFSHYTPEGLSPFDRMAAADITYMYAGENLALAPSVALAHQGLMNSPGHKANILDAHFKRVGIGVEDGGVYGEMFTQEFTD